MLANSDINEKQNLRNKYSPLQPSNIRKTLLSLVLAVIRYKSSSQQCLMKVLDTVVIPEVSSPNWLFKQREGRGDGN